MAFAEGDHDWYADIDPCVCAVQDSCTGFCRAQVKRLNLIDLKGLAPRGQKSGLT